MNPTAHERADLDLVDRIAALEADVAVLMALATVTTARLADLVGEAAPIDDNLTTLKGASFSSGYSQSWVRKLIASGRVSSTKVGRRVLVDKRTLPARGK